MLEYIRKKCRLGIFTQFDLCDESGALKGLFNMPTYAYATDQFEHKKTYYLIVLKMEFDKKISVLPQLNRENARYEDLKNKVTSFRSGESPNRSPPPAPTPSGKTTPMLKVGARKK
ncbi:uncharacterized protein LOC110994987 [Pieris rapae]|uniref:uncharacterized protein LOC110994987 n=1 Tax=Pieris rapae TaxID=64459 RepID=UPI000B9286C9|nr:uncharacterized protein LOC110994987 [Pieris rapae]XP_022117628.1 uncharacterized protein LOC110994987 [Pieris rapae]